MHIKSPHILICLLSLGLLQVPEKLHAQHFADSLQIYAGSNFTIARQDYQPLWLVANRYGTINDQKTDISSHFGFSNKHVFGNSSSFFRNRQQNFSRSSIYDNEEQGGYVKYGLNLYNNQHFQDFFVEETYVKIGYHHWELRGGRYEEVIGEVDPELSSGSLGVSGNALPVPKVGVAATDYTDVPFTQGWLQFKGLFSHGWLGKERIVKKARLHEKSVGVKIGKDSLFFYGGMTHFALWGGEHPNGRLPNRLNDYFRIIVGAPQKENDLFSGPKDIHNALGSHLAVLDFGIQLKLLNSRWRLYTQSIYERGSSPKVESRDEINGFLALTRDRLVGLLWENAEKESFLQNVLFEYLYTKYQGGEEIFIGRFNYYNNAIYGTGWGYNGRVIGTPLFLDKSRFKRYLGEPKNGEWSVVNNRLQGIHMAVKGQVINRLRYKLLLTWTRNFGNYYNDPVFTPAIQQWYSLLSLEATINDQVSIVAMGAYDAGGFGNNLGGQSGIRVSF